MFVLTNPQEQSWKSKSGQAKGLLVGRIWRRSILAAYFQQRNEVGAPVSSEDEKGGSPLFKRFISKR